MTDMKYMYTDMEMNSAEGKREEAYRAVQISEA